MQRQALGAQLAGVPVHMTTPLLRLQLVFPASLTARQRAAVHAIGERYGLPHTSQGEGAKRHIVLGPAGVPALVLGEPERDGSAGTAAPMSDDQLAAFIKQHLQLDAAEEFASVPSSGGGGGGSRHQAVAGEPWRRAEAAAAAKPGSKGLLTPEDFITRFLPLLDMEREAEVAQVLRSGAGTAGSRACECQQLLARGVGDSPTVVNDTRRVGYARVSTDTAILPLETAG